MQFTLRDVGGGLGNTQGGAGGATEGQGNVVKARYDVNKAFADGVIVAANDHRRITGVYSVVVDEIVAKFLFQSLLREEYIIAIGGGDHSLVYSSLTGSVQGLNSSDWCGGQLGRTVGGEDDGGDGVQTRVHVTTRGTWHSPRQSQRPWTA